MIGMRFVTSMGGMFAIRRMVVMPCMLLMRHVQILRLSSGLLVYRHAWQVSVINGHGLRLCSMPLVM